jgi:hypothetical protein
VIPSGATGPATPPPVDKSLVQAWTLGNKLSLAAVAQAERAPVGTVEGLLGEAQHAARELGAEVPPLPPRTGDRTRDSVACLGYLLKTAGPAITNTLESRHGRRQSLLFQSSLKSNLLHVLYEPSADDRESQAIAGFLADKATEAELPRELWSPVVDKVRSRASHQEVKSSVRRMQDSVAAHLAGGTPSTPPVVTPPVSSPPVATIAAAPGAVAASSNPPPGPRALAEGEVYLRTFPPMAVEALDGDDHKIDRSFGIQGVAFQNGIYIHPPKVRSTGRATYDVGGNFARLRGGAGVNQHRFGKAWSPVTFRILGDGRLLWNSKPMQACGEWEAFDVSVVGISRLTLEVECTGDHTGAHGSWMDPVLSKAQ